MRKKRVLFAICLACSLPLLAGSDETVRPHAGMLLYPDVSATDIAFVYANDIWLVSREGGTARPLASPPGQEQFPRFNAAGDRIAFIGNYEGNRDLYTIPVTGGIATRVTYHPAGEVLCDWTPDGRLLFHTNAWSGLGRQRMLYTVAASGGMPDKVPVPYGAAGAISADGTWLAYTPHNRDTRTWKRYRGGMASDVWLYNLKSGESKKITDWEGTDTQPMWQGQTIYYLSDQGSTHRLNIWSYDTRSGKRNAVTKYAAYDVKWPSIGPGPKGRGEIVFQLGPELMLLDLASSKVRPVDVVIPGDRPAIRPKLVDVHERITNPRISSTGKRAVVEARGDIWTLPAEHGSPRNLSRSSGVAERDPAWSPDGQWIAYFSDQGGEYQLYVRQSDGAGEARQVTHFEDGFLSNSNWSPDSKWVTFNDNLGRMHLHSMESNETKVIQASPYGSPGRPAWSHDSRWFAYTNSTDNRQSAIYIYDVKSGDSHQVTSGMFNDSWPTFDRKGDYLYFASQRDFSSPIYEDVGTTFVYSGLDRLYAVPLRKDVPSPLAPKSDEEKWKEGKAEKPEEETAESTSGDEQKPAESDAKPAEESKSGGMAAKGKSPKAVEIDLDGFERRAVQLPVDNGNFALLAVNDKGQLLYVRAPARGIDGRPSVKILDLSKDEKKEDTVIDGVGGFDLSADGKMILVSQQRRLAVLKAAPKQKIEHAIDVSSMRSLIDPREEWDQIFHDAWRMERDFFYDPNMHGVDWQGVHDQYAAMLPDCVTREDVGYVISEMISELNVGHAYYGGGDTEDQPRLAVGLLGADFELADGAYRISGIVEGAPWDVDARGPLSQPGVDVKEGDYLLEVNGMPLDTSKDPYAAFQGMAGKTVVLTVSDHPSLDDQAREVVVELERSESRLRFRNWIEDNRKKVEEASGGRVGYIYVPDTGVNGQNNLFRQFYGQLDKDALIVDERWNGGGQIPTRFIELLNRKATNYWARRYGEDWVWPPDSQQGPKCMLINGMAGSGGDAFPAYFRQAGLGKLIGTRTWGGLVGISGSPALVDGAAVRAPSFAFYELNGTWGIEGHGVDPDIEVIDDPSLMRDGGDPQLQAAIDLMLKELKEHPFHKPNRPPYPNRSGMGIKPDDM